MERRPSFGSGCDVDDGLEVRAAARGDGPPFAVGVELDLLAGAGFAEPAVAGVGLCGLSAIDDEGAVAALVVRGEVPVEGGAGHVEGLCDRFDGVGAVVVHLLGLVELPLGEFGAAAADAAADVAAGTGGGQAIVGVGDDEFALQFGQHAQHADPAIHPYTPAQYTRRRAGTPTAGGTRAEFQPLRGR